MSPLIVLEYKHFFILPHFMGYHYTKKLILVETRLQEVDLGGISTRELKQSSYSNIIGGPLFSCHPVQVF